MKINEISENISHTSKRLRDIERSKGVKPGSDDWFKLWFSLPYLKESIVHYPTYNSVNEAFDTEAEWVLDMDARNQQVYATKIDDAYIELTYKRMLYNGVYISFTRGGVMSVTGEGSQNKIFGAVINHLKQWVGKNKPEQIVFSAFKPRTGAFGSQDNTRSGLYRKMVQRFANQNGYDYDVEDTGNEDTFILTRRQNESLEEDIAWQNSVSKHIFDFKSNEFIRASENFLLPISSSILKNIKANPVRATVFHVTGYDNLDAMIKNQGTKKALSTFFDMDSGRFSSGVQGGGGLVFELDANVLISDSRDIDSKVDNSGRRWIKMKYMARNTRNFNTSGLYEDVPQLLSNLLKKYTNKSYNPYVEEAVYDAWKELGTTLNSTGDGKTLNLLIKDFMDGIYKIYQTHKEDLIKMLRHHLTQRTIGSDLDSWDEIVVNEYKIKKIHVLDSVTLRKNPQVIDRVKSTGIKYDVWNKGSQLGSYIRKIADKEKAELGESFLGKIKGALGFGWNKIGDTVRGSVILDYLDSNDFYGSQDLEKRIKSSKFKLIELDLETAKKYAGHTAKKANVRSMIDPDKEMHSRQWKLTHNSLIKSPPVLMSDGDILDGNHRIDRAIKLELPKIPVLIQVGKGIEENFLESKVNYSTPNFEHEWEEAERYPEFRKIGKAAWIELAGKGKAVTIRSAKGINNTDAADPNSFASLDKTKQRRALDQLKSGTVEMPIVAVYSDGWKELVGGNTRLTAMLAQNGRATVWAFKVPDEVAELAENFSNGDLVENNNSIIDNKKGWGAVPNNQEVDYLGLRVKMSPKTFIDLAAPLQEEPSDKILQHIQSGGKIGSPFLIIEIPESWRDGDLSMPARVVGHEGRNRMLAIAKTIGNAPIEVHFFFSQGLRNRHITDDFKKVLNKGLVKEKSKSIIKGPLFSTTIGENFADGKKTSNKDKTKSLEEEVAWQNSVSKHIFDFEDSDYSTQEERFLLPISSSVLSRLGAKEVRTTVFHVTGYDNLDAMIKNQGTKKAISTFFHMDSGRFSSGVQGGGGLVFELDANILMAAPEDIETKVDKGGRRWIPMEFVARNDGNVNTSEMYDDVPKLLATLLKKYTGKSYNYEEDDVYYQWKKLGKTLNSTGDGKTLNLLIKDFIDGIYEIYQKHKDQLMKLFRHHLADRTPMDDTIDWDEIIANEYKIKKIHILDSVTLRKNPQVIDRVKSTGIKYDVWKKGSKLGSHIKKTVDQEKSEYVAQQQKDNPNTKASSNFNFVKPKNVLWDESKIFNFATAGKLDLSSAISKLSPEEQEWAKLRWQQGLTMKDIGAKYNLTNSQALQQYKSIHDKIRQYLGLKESIFDRLQNFEENFADGKKPGRKGLAKRMGVDCSKSETELRKIAKRSSGEKQRMAHWCANMKGGKKK